MQKEGGSQGRTEAVFRWFQIIAISLAGLWAVFQFGLLEFGKSYVLEVNVSASVGEPVIETGMVPIKISSTVRNTGHKELTLIFATALFGEEHFLPVEEGEEPVINYWSSASHKPYRFDGKWGEREFMYATAFEFFSPDYWLDRNEMQTNEVLFFGDLFNVNLFAYRIEFYAVERCRGIAPFRTCYEFKVETFVPSGDTQCLGDILEVELADLCVQYWRLDKSTDQGKWERVFQRDLYTDHGLILYRREGLLFHQHANAGAPNETGAPE